MITMGFLSLNKGAVYGYRYDESSARCTVEQRQAGRSEATAEAEGDLALFKLAIDNKLRGCDLIGLHVHDVVQGSHVAARAIVMQKKTDALLRTPDWRLPRRHPLRPTHCEGYAKLRREARRMDAGHIAAITSHHSGRKYSVALPHAMRAGRGPTRGASNVTRTSFCAATSATPGRSNVYR